jgi:hypothetical protein
VPVHEPRFRRGGYPSGNKAIIYLYEKRIAKISFLFFNRRVHNRYKSWFIISEAVMTEEIKFRFKTVFRNVMPAVVVMAAGLVGTYLVYNNYLSDRVGASQVNNLEPAAGDETTTAAPAADAPAASSEQFTPAAVPPPAAGDAEGAAAGTKVYNDEGEDSGNGPDTTATPAGDTATPPATGDAPAKPAPATTPPAAQ